MINTIKTIREYTQVYGKDAPAVQYKHGQNIRVNPPTDIVITPSEWTAQCSPHVTITKLSLQDEAPQIFLNSFWARPDKQIVDMLEKSDIYHISVKGMEQSIRIEGTGDLIILVTAEPKSSGTLNICANGNTVRELVRVVSQAHSDIKICYTGSCKHYISYRQTTQDTRGTVLWHNAPINTDYTRITQHSILRGAHAKTHAKHMVKATSESIYDINLSCDHQAEHTDCTFIGRAVAHSKSKVLLRGKLDMDEQSSFSNGTQNFSVLTVDDTAEADAVPELDIRNEQVTCSHKASIQGISPEDLFFFEQRGMDTPTARRMIIEGFLTQ